MHTIRSGFSGHFVAHHTQGVGLSPALMPFSYCFCYHLAMIHMQLFLVQSGRPACLCYNPLSLQDFSGASRLQKERAEACDCSDSQFLRLTILKCLPLIDALFLSVGYESHSNKHKCLYSSIEFSIHPQDQKLNNRYKGTHWERFLLSCPTATNSLPDATDGTRVSFALFFTGSHEAQDSLRVTM